MSENDLFEQEEDTSTVEPVVLEQKDDKEYLADLVGDDKKFKSTEDLAKGKVESDMFIDRLQGEMQGLREELKTRVTLQDFMDQMETKNSAPSKPTEPVDEKPTETPKSGISPEDFESLLDSKLQKRELELRVGQNLENVKTTLQKEWGNNYVQELRKKASEIGVKEDFLNDVAKAQPNAFFKLVGIGQTQDNTTVDDTNTNLPKSAIVSTTDGVDMGVKNEEYYNRIKDKDPNDYWSAKTQNELHDQAIKLGEDFFTRR